MVRRCGIWMTVLALVATTGGHWMILQMCAWTGMFARFAQEVPLREAVSKTLDGRHPCRMCLVIRQGRAEERQTGQALPSVAAKLDLLAPKPCGVLDFNGSEGRLVAFGLLTGASRDRSSPPRPPPRTA